MKKKKKTLTLGQALARLPLAHVAIAVKRLESSAALYRKKGYTLADPEVIAREQVRLQVAVKDDMKIELLEAYPAGKGPIAKFLAKRGPGLHHVALRSKHLEKDLVLLKSAGVQVQPGYPAPGAEGSRIAFLDPKTTGGVLFELVCAG